MGLTVEGGLMLLINFAAFTGNLLMCFVLYKKPRFHTTANTFILSLTICHVFTSCLVMPFNAGSLVAGEWLFGQILCDIQGFLFLALTWVSLQLLTIMVACRYFKVTQLVFHKKWFSLNRSITMIMIILVFDAVVLIFPTILGGATFQFSPKRSPPCTGPLSLENQTVNILNTVITLALYITLLISSIMAMCAIRRHEATFFGARRRVTLLDMRLAAEEKRTDKVLLALTAETLLIWMPSVIIKLLEFPTQPVMVISPHIHLASTFLWFSVPVLHPVTYGVLCRPFSREVLRVVPSKRLRQNKVQAEHGI